jgi:carbon-monoxide dehydrogenase medium subunit
MYRVLKPFEFFEPATLEEALRLLSMYGAKAKILAGGVALVLDMRLRKVTPEYVVSIQKIPDLNYIKIESNNSLKFGALTTLHSLERSPLIQDNYQVLFEAIHQIHSVQAKIMGTAIGNICAATPASDLASVLLILDAKLKIASAESERIVDIDSFFVGVRKSILQSREMVTEIQVPSIPARTGCTFLKLTKTTADIGKLSVSVAMTITDNTCQDAKIALGSVAPTPMRARQAEQTLRGRKLDKSAIARAAEIAAIEAKPITDLWSNVEYRKEMVKVLVRRAIFQVLERLGKGNRGIGDML